MNGDIKEEKNRVLDGISYAPCSLAKTGMGYVHRMSMRHAMHVFLVKSCRNAPWLWSNCVSDPVENPAKQL